VPFRRWILWGRRHFKFFHRTTGFARRCRGGDGGYIIGQHFIIFYRVQQVN
jgi:hypothetical protein